MTKTVTRQFTPPPPQQPAFTPPMQSSKPLAPALGERQRSRDALSSPPHFIRPSFTPVCRRHAARTVGPGGAPSRPTPALAPRAEAPKPKSMSGGGRPPPSQRGATPPPQQQQQQPPTTAAVVPVPTAVLRAPSSSPSPTLTAAAAAAAAAAAGGTGTTAVAAVAVQPLPPVSRAAVVAAERGDLQLCLVAILIGQPPMASSVRQAKSRSSLVANQMAYCLQPVLPASISRYESCSGLAVSLPPLRSESSILIRPSFVCATPGSAGGPSDHRCQARPRLLRPKSPPCPVPLPRTCSCWYSWWTRQPQLPSATPSPRLTSAAP